jgi:hypothetical protein
MVRFVSRILVEIKFPDEEILEEGASADESTKTLTSLFHDLDAIRGETGVADDGVTDRDKFARVIADESRYRA